jgi:hypothetical protein
MRLRFWMVLMLVPLVGILATAFPAAALIEGNTLDLSDGSAPEGTLGTVTLDLANEDAVGGIQADILFDSSVVVFSGVTATGRGTGMTAEGRSTESGHLRVVMFFGGSGSLASGEGPIAELTFAMQGASGDVSSLTIQDIILSDPDGEPLTKSGTPGSLTVSPPVGTPSLSISALKNPGHTPIVNIMVKVTGGSGNAPVVSASGSAVTMSSLGDGVFQGQHFALATQSSLTITATDTNSHGTGNAQVTLALP